MVPDALNQPGPQGFPEIPGYAIEGLLGRGSTGTVYRARQLAVDRIVALKVLHAELAGRKRAVRRLQREARTTARLAHPNIVSAIDMGQSGGLWWYAMELVDGPSLAERLKQEGRLSEREALRIFIPLVEALEHAFEHGVVHRDIKPANILVERSGRARLVDLGLAFAEDDPMLTAQGGTLGTPHYIAPEQARNPQAADGRSDIWSLGASLYHTLCGRPPFSGESVAEILSGVLYSRVPDPAEFEPTLSKNVKLVLRKCLSRDPDRRYQRPGQLLEDLEAIRERRQVAVQRRDLDPLAGEATRRRRLAWAGALTLAAVAAVSLAVKRPWERGGVEPLTGTDQSVPFYAPLESVAAEARRGERFLAYALTELERLQSTIPPEFETRYRALRAELYRGWNGVVDGLNRELTQDLARLQVEQRDYVAALARLDGLDAELRKSLNPSDVQLATLRESLGVERRRAEVEGDLREALSHLEEQLADVYRTVVFPRVATLLQRGRFADARAELEVGVGERMQAAKLDPSGLPAAQVEALVQVQAKIADSKRDELEQSWREFDRDRVAFVEEQFGMLEARLRERSLSGGPRQLRQAFERWQKDHGHLLDQQLTDVSDAGGAALAARAEQLRGLEVDLLEQDARDLYTLRMEEAAPLWARRDYRALESLWQEAIELPYLAPVRSSIVAQRTEAQLLQGLLERALEGARRRAESGSSGVIRVGTIGYEGELVMGEDPLDKGLRLIPNGAGAGAGQPITLLLKRSEGVTGELLHADVIEELAGLEPAPVDPRERLLRALFRDREGDLAAVQALLPLPELEDPDLAALAAELERRVRVLQVRADQTERQQLAEAERLWQLINREAFAPHTGTAEATVKRIDQLLTLYGHLPVVRERAPRLRAMKRELQPAAEPVTVESLKASFGADEVTLKPSNREVHMAFAFDTTQAGAWLPRDWRPAPDGLGWQAPEARSGEQLFSERLWPRLVLRPPLQLDQRMAVELEIHQPEDSGPPRLLVISVAGVHVALRGAQLDKQPVWAIGSGSPDDYDLFLRGVLDRGEGTPFAGLRRGATHVLRVELTNGRGRGQVFLDGVELGSQAAPRPEGEPGTASIVVRSMEPVRLLSATFDGRYR